ncbi:F-box only protein 36-like [Sinocyclocheilus rhinocerous]|uniref:F-box only protein 36-like n=1 Tax=Sinocyclocheilus rhinocerous TaxID=307959 RepID=A0A673ISA9_9TELE|nr:PREDICTED: F-box only protein 36-like [Sinocyclocheilus rhinocerous]
MTQAGVYVVLVTRQRNPGMASLLGETLFEISGQGPAPIKDYFHFAITKSQVIWSWWKISLRSDCRNTPPGQLTESHEDFLEDNRLQNQVGMVFGPHILQYSQNLCQGHYDYIVRLPNALLFNIMAHLDLEDISVISRTCRRFRELCNSEEFWEQTVRKHCDTVTPTVEALAEEVGWRTVFFTNKLQLQMQISRRKQKENQPCEDKNEPSPSSVPLE